MTVPRFAAAGGAAMGEAAIGDAAGSLAIGWITHPGGDGCGVRPPVRAAGERSTDATPRRLRVAVVEDEAIIALEIEDLLTDLGAEVIGSALSADEAVRLAGSMRPDCMTMDIRLQGQRDGVDAALEIYRRFGVRCIFVSAYDDAATMTRAEPARPLGWIGKPIRPDRLENHLRDLMRDLDLD